MRNNPDPGRPDVAPLLLTDANDEELGPVTGAAGGPEELVAPAASDDTTLPIMDWAEDGWLVDATTTSDASAGAREL